MRGLFWLLCFVCLAVLVYAWAGIDPPEIPDVGGARLDEWYRARMMWTLVFGMAWGLFWAVRNRSRRWGIKHQPHESGRQFNSRVAWSGVLALTVAGAVIGPFVLIVMSFTATFVPLALSDRIYELLFAAKTLGVIGGAAVGAGVIYALMTRYRRWGGQYSLIPAKLKSESGQ